MAVGSFSLDGGLYGYLLDSSTTIIRPSGWPSTILESGMLWFRATPRSVQKGRYWKLNFGAFCAPKNFFEPKTSALDSISEICKNFGISNNDSFSKVINTGDKFAIYDFYHSQPVKPLALAMGSVSRAENSEELRCPHL